MRRIVVTVAGLDSSGGAGLHADMRAFGISGVHAYHVITCITVQNPDRVFSIHPIDEELLKDQLERVLALAKPSIIKLGMIYRGDNLRCVADIIEDRKIERVVADPVLKASDGTMLCDESYIKVYRERLIPLVYLLTPNMEEAGMLSGFKGDVCCLAEHLNNAGAENVLIKGGDLGGKESIDVLFDGRRFYRFSLPRIRGRWHGTGCVFASLIAGNLSKGMGIRRSIDVAKRILWSMMLNSFSIGSEVKILGDPREFDIPPEGMDGERFAIWYSLNRMIKSLLKILPSDMIPEVGINVGYALRNARSIEDVCALEGRITRGKSHGLLKFGASEHVARMIITAMRFDERKRAGMNLRYREEIVERFEEEGFLVSSFDRREEPAYSRSTMEWGVNRVVEEVGRVPDVIWDRGGHGKEPMIRLLGNDPRDLLVKIRRVL